MTTEDARNLREDIAFMRALADEGVKPPLLAGPVLMIAGATFASVSVFSWADTRFLHLPWQVEPATYIVVMLIFMAARPWRWRGVRGRPGAKAPANRATAHAWSGIGWGIFAYVAAMMVACWKLKTGVPAMMTPTVVLVLYGAAWTVAAAMTGQRFLWGVAAGCYASAVLIILFLNTPEVYLVFAAILMLVAFLPGYLLWKREPKDVV